MLTAKLPSVHEPGFVNKRIVPVLQHGENSFYSLYEEASDPYRTCFIEYRGWLFAIDSFNNLQNNLSKIPTAHESLLELIRNSFLHGSSFLSTHKNLWEVLDLPMNLRDLKVAEIQEQKRQREENRLRAEEQFRANELKKIQDRIQKNINVVKNNDSVSGEDLIELAAFFNISIHPRTIGVLNKFSSISSTRATGANTASKKIWDVYFAVQAAANR